MVTNMKKHLQRKAAGILLLAALLSAVSCGSGGNDPEPKQTTENTAVTADAGTNTEDTEAAYRLGLPEDLDYGGEEIVIFGWDHYEDIEFYTEAMNGEIVNDAVYERNRNVSENLNVSLTFLKEGGRAGDSSWTRKVSQANKAGDAAYDIVAGHSFMIGNLAKAMELINLTDLSYLDLGQPWWRKELTERALIRDKLYFVTGDICPSSVSRSQGIFFNISILQQFDLEDPYTLVIDGTWTLDKMIEMSKGIYADLNANGKNDEAGDRFGFSIDGIQIQAIALTSGIVSVEADDAGDLIVSPDYMTDRTVSLADQWIDYIHNNDDTVLIKTGDDTTVFREGRALFYAFPLGIISSELRDCDFNIGFVPFPKADEQQEDYIVCTSNAYSLWSIPISAQDSAMSAAVMENLGYEGYRLIMPAMFETAYKVKYNNTDSMLQSQVFDILRSNLIFDIGRIMSGSLTGDIFFLFPDAVNSGKNNLSSKFAAVEKKVNKQLEAWMDEIEASE